MFAAKKSLVLILCFLLVFSTVPLQTVYATEDFSIPVQTEGEPTPAEEELTPAPTATEESTPVPTATEEPITLTAEIRAQAGYAELLTVSNDSVSFGKNQPIRKGTTKTKAGIRTAPICDLLLEVIEYTMSMVDKGPLFLMDNGSPITKIGMRRSFEYLNRHLLEHAKNTGNSFTRIRPHDCRHTYATALYDAGVDVKTVQYLLGHSDIHTTLQLYTHLSRQKLNKGVKHILSYLNKWVTDIPIQEDN